MSSYNHNSDFKRKNSLETKKKFKKILSEKIKEKQQIISSNSDITKRNLSSNISLNFNQYNLSKNQQIIFDKEKKLDQINKINKKFDEKNHEIKDDNSFYDSANQALYTSPSKNYEIILNKNEYYTNKSEDIKINRFSKNIVTLNKKINHFNPENNKIKNFNGLKNFKQKKYLRTKSENLKDIKKYTEKNIFISNIIKENNFFYKFYNKSIYNIKESIFYNIYEDKYKYDIHISNKNLFSENYLYPYTTSFAKNVLSEKQTLYLHITIIIIIILVILYPIWIVYFFSIFGQFLYFQLTLHKNIFFYQGKNKESVHSSLLYDWIGESYTNEDLFFNNLKSQKSKKIYNNSQNNIYNNSYNKDIKNDLIKLNNSKIAPYYTILLPVYKENYLVLNTLVKNINQIIYPREKLQVLLIIEDHDQITKKAIDCINLPNYFEIISVPTGTPQTKGRALNYALKFTIGEYVVVYDAEDKPDCYQLLKAIRCFNLHQSIQKQQHPNEREYLACVQARLNFHNKDESIISSFFSLEYAMQFNYLMPAMTQSGIFVPLGGTSNHFTSHALKKLNGWDIYNVTEDADIGMRISLLGWKIAMINSVTLEEAPISMKAWIKQRTRWFKGHMQTFLVHMRKPTETYKKLGIKGFINFVSLMGIATFGVAFILPGIISYVGSIYLDSLFTYNQRLILLSLSSFNLIFWIISVYSSFNIIRKEININLFIFIIIIIYFIMHLIAAVRAIIELIFNPHYWDKTQHGVSKMYEH
ncbi:glycosyltransferase [Lyticum sinuosum]|uniref:Glycosyltransferase n=1 Tax=Lyticum sinuosum TaxID=1332059 RepID=A0AAE5AH37_9RICK|nr:glycosyltransferase [Lyticum sinuosum]MDZ5761537.1 glycosyltransferase [Lyticum sinuosum]